MAQRKRGAAAREAAARATSVAGAREAAREVGRRGTTAEPLTTELRRRDVLPLLVLHYINAGPTYGNQLMERISALGPGVVSINPNTMYPLLRQLESRGLIEGKWEHPERRSRRYYSITPQGRKEYKRLHGELRPLLDSISRSIGEIVREVYG
jgi:PadR family transcriptional regulator PadR